MGLLDSIKAKAQAHNEEEQHHASVDHRHHDGTDPQKSDTQNWVAKGQGVERSDGHGIRAGSLTEDNTGSTLTDGKVHDAIMKDENRIGSVTE